MNRTLRVMVVGVLLAALPSDPGDPRGTRERSSVGALGHAPDPAVKLASGSPLELYDLAADPREQRSVAAENAAVVAQVESYLRTARTPSEHWPVASP